MHCASLITTRTRRVSISISSFILSRVENNPIIFFALESDRSEAVAAFFLILTDLNDPHRGDVDAVVVTRSGGGGVDGSECLGFFFELIGGVNDKGDSGLASPCSSRVDRRPVEMLGSRGAIDKRRGRTGTPVAMLFARTITAMNLLESPGLWIMSQRDIVMGTFEIILTMNARK